MRIVLLCLNLPDTGSQFAIFKIVKFLLLFIFLSVFINQTQAQHDLEIASVSDVDSAGVGDEVTFTITLYNEGGTVLSGVMVKDLLPANMTYVSAVPAIGNYTSSTGIWDLMSSFTDSVKLILTARLDAPGVHYNVAEVYAMDGFDVDSEPNDGIITDDDYTSSCVSIPFKICTNFNDTIVLTAPTGYDGYQWAMDGVDIVGETSQVYKATQPGEYTFNADNILTNCSGGSCCPIEIENACFDLALDKKLASGQSANVMPGDDVTYTITVHNQGDYYADSIEITDYIPVGMVNNTNNWGGNDTLLTIADGQLAPDGLAPNTTISVDITLTVSSPTAVDSLLNYAEISSARDTSGTDSRDIDSAPDATNNDPGGASNSAADDYVNGDGQGTVGDGVASTDEDDHDVEVIYICPTITNPTADFAICSGDAVGTLSVTTSTTDDIHFVYFTSAQTGNNMYTGGTSLGTATPSSGTASITPSSFPTTPGTYFVYAIIDPAIDNGSCEPFEEIEITVNQLPTANAGMDHIACGDVPVNLTATTNGTGTWTGGAGTFGDATMATTTYTPTAGEEGTTVTLTWTTTDPDGAGPCVAVSDMVDITFNSEPLITPTVTDATVCSGSSVSIMIDNTELGVSYQLRNDEDDSNAFPPMNGNGGTITFTINPVTDSVVYNVFASTGDGCMIELTDKAVINVPECDFGDLPDASITGLSPDYETTLADNGPYHYIVPMLSLGDNIDSETDATPDGMATGDDDDALPDDEDGITFFPTLNIVPGGTIRLPIDVINGTGTTAYLEGWIDWNGDGILDAGEIIVDIDDSTTAFPTFITVAVPAVIADNVPIGARFRLSHTPDMSPYGRVESGEIEDYLIQIDCATGTCIPMSSIIKRGTKD